MNSTSNLGSESRLNLTLPLIDKRQNDPIKIKEKRAAFRVHDMNHAFISIEKAFEYVGDNSKFQKLIITILSIQWVFYSFFVMGMPIMLKSPEFKCYSYESRDFTHCEEKDYCALLKSKEFDKIKLIIDKNSLVMDFNLYCDNDFQLAKLASMFFVGQMMAGIVMSIISDRIGRRKSLLTSMCLGAGAVFACGFAQEIDLLMVLITLAGFGLSGYETIIYAYVTEISGSRFRNFSGNILFMMWGLAQIIYSYFSPYIPSWRTMCTLIIGTPLIVSLIFAYRYFIESPRYLISKKNYQGARDVLRYISTYNLRPPFEFHLLQEMDIYNSLCTQLRKKSEKIKFYSDVGEQVESKGSQSLFNICYYPSVRWMTMIMLSYWFTRYFVYYGISFSLSKLGSSLYINFLFLGLAEVLAAFISTPMKLTMKRVQSFRISLFAILIGSSLLFFVIVPQKCYEANIVCWQEIITLVVAIFFKFSITFFTVILMTYTSEIYPTVIRSQGYGLCMTFGQIGSILAPIYIRHFAVNYELNPLTILLFVSIINIIQTLFLEETHKKQMYDSFKEENQQKAASNNAQQQGIELQTY